MTVICKGYVAHHEANGIRLEIEEPVPADVLPRLISKADAIKRLAISPNHLKKLTKQAGIRPVEELPVRYRESDLLKLTLPAGEQLPVVPAIVPMRTVKTKAVVVAPPPPAATTAAALPPRKTKLHL